MKYRILVTILFLVPFYTLAQVNAENILEMNNAEFYKYVGNIKDPTIQLKLFNEYHQNIKNRFSNYNPDRIDFECMFVSILFTTKDYKKGLLIGYPLSLNISRILGPANYKLANLYTTMGRMESGVNVLDSALFYFDLSNEVLFKSKPDSSVFDLLAVNNLLISELTINNEITRAEFYQQSKKLVQFFKAHKIVNEAYYIVLTSFATEAFRVENDEQYYKEVLAVADSLYKGKNIQKYFTALYFYMQYYAPRNHSKFEYLNLLDTLLENGKKKSDIPLDDFVSQSLIVIHSLRFDYFDPVLEFYYLDELDSIVEKQLNDKNYYFSKALIQNSMEVNYSYMTGYKITSHFLLKSIEYLEKDQNKNNRKQFYNGASIYQKFANYLWVKAERNNRRSLLDSIDIYYNKAIEAGCNDNLTCTYTQDYINFLIKTKEYAKAERLIEYNLNKDSVYYGTQSSAYASSLCLMGSVFDSLHNFHLANAYYKRAVDISKVDEVVYSSCTLLYADFLFRNKDYENGLFYLSESKKFDLTNNYYTAGSRGGNTMVHQYANDDNFRQIIFYFFKKGNIRIELNKHEPLLNYILDDNRWFRNEKSINSFIYSHDSKSYNSIKESYNNNLQDLNNLVENNSEYLSKVRENYIKDSVGVAIDFYQGALNIGKDELKKVTQYNYLKLLQSRLKESDIFIKAFSGAYLSAGHFVKGTEFKGFLIIKKGLENPVLIFDKSPDDIFIQTQWGMNSLVLSNSVQQEISFLLKGVSHIYFSPQKEFANVNFLQTKINGSYLIDHFTATNIDDLQSFCFSEYNKHDTIRDILIVANPMFLLDQKTANTIASNNKINATEKETLLNEERYQQNKSNLGFEFDENSLIVKSKAINEPESRMGGTQFLPPLPFTAIEAQNIKELASSNNIKVSMKQMEFANEDEIKRVIENYDIVHFSTHGFYRGDRDTLRVWKAEYLPYFKVGLCLAGAQNTLNVGKPYFTNLDNGILTGFEIKNLNLAKTKLVVLSSCETGIGDIVQAESNYSLQRAFSIAGAKTVLVTLWKVSDKATQILMKEFYRNWLTLKMSKAKALQQAQLFLKNSSNYSSPRYWGPFVLVGE